MTSERAFERAQAQAKEDYISWYTRREFQGRSQLLKECVAIFGADPGERAFMDIMREEAMIQYQRLIANWKGIVPDTPRDSDDTADLSWLE